MNGIIEEVDYFDRGVVVKVTLKPDALRVQEAWGNKDTISLRVLRQTFFECPALDAEVGVVGYGLQVKKDGTVGSRARSNVSVAPRDVPEEVRAYMVATARAAFLAGRREPPPPVDPNDFVDAPRPT